MSKDSARVGDSNTNSNTNHDTKEQNHTNYTRQAVHGAGIAFILGSIAALIAYGTRIFLARKLGPEDYGLFSAVLTFVVFFLFLRDLGLLPSLVKSIATWRVEGAYSKIKAALVGVGLFQLAGTIFLGGMLFFLAEPLALQYFKDARAIELLWLFFIYIFLSIFFILVKAVFRGSQKMLLFSSVEVVKNAVVLLGTLLFYFWGYGLWAPVLAYMAVCPILFFIYAPFAAHLSRFFSVPAEQMRSISREVISYGLPLFAISVADKTMSYVDTLLLTHFRTLSEVGIYNVVLPSAFMLLFIGRALSVVVFPLSSELQARQDRKRLLAGIELLHKYLFLFFIPGIGALLISAPFLIPLVFGNEYATGIFTFQLLVIGMMLFIMAIVDTNVLSAVGHAKKVAKIVLFGAAVNLLLNLLLIPLYGMEGAGVANLAGYAFTLFLAEAALRRHLKTVSPLRIWAVQGAGGIVFLLLTLLMQYALHFPWWVELSLGLLMATIGYALFLLAFRQIDVPELRFLWKRVRR